MTSIDHIVLAASDLQQGAAYIKALTGLTPVAGGKHHAMGTHNLLMSLGGRRYLEVIAIDPEAAAPSRPRWFGLDEPDLAQAIAKEPALVTWVAEVDDIDVAARGCSYDAGVPVPMSRESFNWQISITDDGALPLGGLAPALIQWPQDLHPSNKMPGEGCTLEALTLVSDRPSDLAAALASIEATTLVAVEGAPAGGAVGMQAVLSTPLGSAKLT